MSDHETDRRRGKTTPGSTAGSFTASVRDEPAAMVSTEAMTDSDYSMARRELLDAEAVLLSDRLASRAPGIEEVTVGPASRGHAEVLSYEGTERVESYDRAEELVTTGFSPVSVAHLPSSGLSVSATHLSHKQVTEAEQDVANLRAMVSEEQKARREQTANRVSEVLDDRWLEQVNINVEAWNSGDTSRRHVSVESVFAGGRRRRPTAEETADFKAAFTSHEDELLDFAFPSGNTTVTLKDSFEEFEVNPA